MTAGSACAAQAATRVQDSVARRRNVVIGGLAEVVPQAAWRRRRVWCAVLTLVIRME
jgi:hypothetical protein